jgi:glycosyltransferase involved in cell wall biosynthesis
MENTERVPIVSVIIPSYNRERLLMRAIGSVQAQTFSDWEMIIVDDGSKDDTEQAVKRIQKKDARIFYFKNDVNKGVSAARNIAIKKARGKYLAFLDSDDAWLPEKLDRQVDVLEKGSEKLGLVYTSAVFINEKTNERRVKLAEKDGDIFTEEFANHPIGGTSRVMIKRECIKVCGDFNEKMSCNEDWDLWIRITKNFLVACIKVPLVLYFEGNPDSLSINAEALIEGYEILWKKYDINNFPGWIRAAHYFRLGHRLFYYGDVARGRKYLWRALQTDPWKPKYVIVLMISFIGRKFYRKLTFFAMKNIV